MARAARLATDPQVREPRTSAAVLDIFGFELTDEELAEISGLADPRGRLFGGDPDSHEEM